MAIDMVGPFHLCSYPIAEKNGEQRRMERQNSERRQLSTIRKMEDVVERSLLQGGMCNLLLAKQDMQTMQITHRFQMLKIKKKRKNTMQIKSLLAIM